MKCVMQNSQPRRRCPSRRVSVPVGALPVHGRPCGVCNTMQMLSPFATSHRWISRAIHVLVGSFNTDHVSLVGAPTPLPRRTLRIQLAGEESSSARPHLARSRSNVPLSLGFSRDTMPSSIDAQAINLRGSDEYGCSSPLPTNLGSERQSFDNKDKCHSPNTPNTRASNTQSITLNLRAKWALMRCSSRSKSRPHLLLEMERSSEPEEEKLRKATTAALYELIRENAFPGAVLHRYKRKALRPLLTDTGDDNERFARRRRTAPLSPTRPSERSANTTI